MIKIYIAQYKAKDCHDSSIDLYMMLKNYGVDCKYSSYNYTIIIEGEIQITYIRYTPENLLGLRCDCIVGVNKYEKYKAEYGSDYNHLFKNIYSEARLVNELVCVFRGRK